MPFHDLSLKLVIVIASLLAHHVLVVQCASLRINPNATIQAPALSKPSALESTLGQTAPSDLLDESELTFLADCKIDAVTVKICELYRNLTALLSQRKRDPVTATDVHNIIAEPADGNRFCDDFIPLLQAMRQKHPDRFEQNSLENRRVCDDGCVPYDPVAVTLSMYVKPICKAILWGFKKELQSEVEQQDPVKQAAKVLMPPMVPIAGGQIVQSEHAESNPAKPVAAAQPNITLPVSNEKASSPKKTEADQTKVSPDTAAVMPPAVITDGAASQPTAAASTPTKPVTADKTPMEGEESQDPNELRNQQNLNDMNGNSQFNNVQDDGDTDDETLVYDEAQDTSDIQSKVQDEPVGMKKTDSGSTAGDQRADSAVQVERVEQEDPFFDQDDSNFFSYFLFMMFMCILCYVAYHNKSKLLALLLEGRRTSSGRGGFNKGRKHTAAYRKLDSNLEEAITSNAAASSRSTSQIIY